MEKRVTRIYISLLILGIAGAVIFAPFAHAAVYDRTEAQKAEVWDERMVQTTEGESSVYQTILPSEGIGGKVIAYNSAHMEIEVTIDNETVYSLMAENPDYMKTTGYYWNFISFTEADAGKELIFRITPVYADCEPKGNFYYGERSAVERLIVKERIFRFATAAIILLVGILMLLYYVLIARKGQENEAFLHFTVFAGTLGVWYSCETQILELLLPWHILIALIDHLMLMLFPIPFLLFVRQLYRTKAHVLWDVSCYLNCAAVVLRLLLQITGICDLRGSLWITHVTIGCSIAVIVAFSIYEIVTGKLSKQARRNIFCVLVILFFVMLELVEYRTSTKNIPFGCIGFLFYIAVMSIAMVQESRGVMEQAKASELYRKLAFTDELTGLYNRAAFNRDLENRRVPDEEKTVYKILPTVLFMFDLNDLKKCNDGYGHEYGDRYIRMVSEVIRQVFGPAGNCYRIGGDEFCTVMDFTSQEDIKDRYRRFLEEIEKKNEQSFVVPVSVAAGYAVYDSEKDVSLEDAMKRADEMMYRNKQELKRRAAPAGEDAHFSREGIG